MADDRIFWLETGLHVADVLWTCFVLTPLTIFYWGGTWKLMDLFVFPDDTFHSSVVSLAVGIIGCLSGYLILPLLDCCHPQRQTFSLKHVVVSRTCVYVLAAAVLNYWRGIWQLMDYYVGIDPLINGICVGMSSLVLVCFRSLGSVVSAPFSHELDVSPHIYRPITRFKVQPNWFWLYLCDVLLSHLLIKQLVIQVWRGLWNLMEAGILPGDVLLSYCVSLGAGVGGAFILFILQHPLAIVANCLLKIHWTAMLILQDVVHIAGVLVTLLVWRGGWGLNRDYLLENTMEAAVAHGIASAGLLLCQALSSVSTLNIGVDAAGHSTTGFYYNIHYFWYFWRGRQEATDYLQVQVERNSGTASRGLLEDSDDDLISAR